MREVVTNDKAMIEQMVAMSKHFGAAVNVTDLSDGRFRITMSDDDAAKLPKVNDDDA